MARYAVISKGLTISQLQEEVKRYGGRNLKVASVSKQIFCDLDNVGREKLNSVPGLVVKVVGKVKHQQVLPLPYPGAEVGFAPAWSASQASIWSGFYDLRETFTPPITGRGSTIAILDSGIRKTHYGLANKVIYEANFTDSPTCDDIFDHGTAVAYMAAGGSHGVGQECGLAPDAYLINIKVLNDEGEGTDEMVVAGIEECYSLEREADRKGLKITDPMDINWVNMSWGKPDEGDPDDPIRVAIRTGIEEGIAKFAFFAAAGNTGPAPGSINCPACDRNVLAVGALTFYPLAIWERSSRGPSKEGLIKPECSGFASTVVAAGSKSDDAFVMKAGTSFSSPGVAGAWAIMFEAYRRRYGEELGEQWVMDIEYLESMMAPLCVKPEGVPAGKDNDYGWGILSGVAAKQAAMGVGVLVEPIISALAPILTIGMMGMMIIPLTKGLR